MTTPRPLEDPRARVRTLYQAIASTSGRILEVRTEPEGARTTHEEWIADAEAAAPFAPASFGLIILHDTIDVLAARCERNGRSFDAAAFLARLTPLLAASGVIAGSVGNRLAPARWPHLIRDVLRARPRNSNASASDVTTPRQSPRSCRRVLRRAGLADVSLFAVHPHIEAPRLLLSTRFAPWRTFASRELATRRRDLSLLAYCARRFAVGTGLGRFLPPNLFFAGCRS